MENHFIQKKFIENFCGNNGILIYDIKNDKILHKHKKANNIVVEHNLYHFENIDYPDEQIEKDLKRIEDKGLDTIKSIAENEYLPLGDDLYNLLSYLYYQSLRTPSQMEMKREEINKLNKICKSNDFTDLPLYQIYDDKSSKTLINSISNDYNIYLIKYEKPIFIITDCFCDSMQSRTEQTIPITSNLALHLIPKKHKSIFNLDLKENIANSISFEKCLNLTICSVFAYKQFAFASYTDTNCKLVPTVFKLLKKSC